jgi:hypothetical protein
MFVLYSERKLIKLLKNVYMIRLILLNIKYCVYNNFCFKILSNLRISNNELNKP